SVVFRCDAGPEIGAGHVYGCAALAGVLAGLGWHCRFRVGPHTPATVPALRAAGFLIELAAGGPAEDVAALARSPAAWLVVDHYDRDIAFERACRAFCGRILVIADAPLRRHDCDILLDPTPG